MTILDLIKKTAVIFNVEQVLEDSDLESLTNNTQVDVLNGNEQLNKMFELCKLVLCEVYSYISKELEVSVQSANGQIDKGLLGEVGKIISVKSQNKRVNFVLDNDTIKVDRDGEYIIKCVVAPNVKYLNNEIDMLNGDITEDVLINGLNAYYCLTAGLFEEYNVYNVRYIDNLSRLKNPKLFAMPCRSWHE